MGAYWWDGSSWEEGIYHWVWDGSEWLPVIKLFVWNGSAWQNFYTQPVTIEILSAEVFFCDDDNPLLYELIVTYNESPDDYPTLNTNVVITDANDDDVTIIDSTTISGSTITYTGDLSGSIGATPPFTVVQYTTVNGVDITGSPVSASNGSCI